MGGKSSSSSKSSNATTQIDRRIGASENGQVFSSEGGAITVNTTTTDAGAVAASMGAVNRSLDSVDKTSTGAFALVDKVTGEAFGFGQSALEAIDSNTQTAFGFVEQIRKEADERKFETFMTAGTIAVVAYFASRALR